MAGTRTRFTLSGALSHVFEGFSDPRQKYIALRPSAKLHEHNLGVEDVEICTPALFTDSSGTPFRERLNVPTEDISVVGSYALFTGRCVDSRVRSLLA